MPNITLPVMMLLLVVMVVVMGVKDNDGDGK